MNWLVTGAAGFIGFNLCNYLLSRGHYVVGYDNLSTGYISNIKRLQDCFGDSFLFVKGDLSSFEKLVDIVPHNVHVVHLAAQVSVPKSVTEPDFNLSVNELGFVNFLLFLSKNSSVSCFLFAYLCSASFKILNGTILDEKE